jgi:hypothetical protein
MGAAAPDAPGDGERGATSSKPTTGPRRPITTPLSTAKLKDEPPPTTRQDEPRPTATPKKVTTDDRATLKSAGIMTPRDRQQLSAPAALDPDTAPTTLKTDQIPAFTDPPPTMADPPSALRGLPASALFELAGARLLERDVEGAREACDWARRADPDNQDLAALAIWLRAQIAGADLKLLTIELDELLAAAPDHRNARFYRGMLRKRLGDNTGAIRDLRRLLERTPPDAEAAKALEALEGSAEKPRSSLLGWLLKR